ncbi:MAG: hypothetical protein HKN85_00635 [Gammaproteobacteria bacterium]|nr:hypothetical protein [Gammaproteobacteria bacterium]
MTREVVPGNRRWKAPRTSHEPEITRMVIASAESTSAEQWISTPIPVFTFGQIFTESRLVLDLVPGLSWVSPLQPSATSIRQD